MNDNYRYHNGVDFSKSTIVTYLRFSSFSKNVVAYSAMSCFHVNIAMAR